MGILVAVDDTDHLDFYCPECDGGMDVVMVETKKKYLYLWYMHMDTLKV